MYDFLATRPFDENPQMGMPSSLGFTGDAYSLLGQWKDGNRQIDIYLSGNSGFSNASVFGECRIDLASKYIQCGILGRLSQEAFIQKIKKFAEEKIAEYVAVYAFPFEGEVKEVWIFEATPMAASYIKKAKEDLKLIGSSSQEEAIKRYQQILKNFEAALKIQEQQKGDTQELNLAILQIKKEHFLLTVKPHLYLPSGFEVGAFNEVINLYKEQEDLFFCLSDYIQAVEEIHAPHLNFLSALVLENANDPVAAIPYYIRLSRSHPEPLHCLKKAESLAKGSSDPFAFPHFLENLNHDWLVRLGDSGSDVKIWIQQKDAIRTAFEDCLKNLAEKSLSKKQIFIFCAVLEEEISRWLGSIVPDLITLGASPLVPLEGQSSIERVNFEQLIRASDHVIIACNSELKKLCTKHSSDEARVIRIVTERFYNEDKRTTVFPIYFERDRKTSCISPSLESISETFSFNYYSIFFDAFTAMCGISREASQQAKELFLDKIQNLEINLQKIELWREQRSSRANEVLQLSQDWKAKCQLSTYSPSCSPYFIGRERELKLLDEACKKQRDVIITGLGGVGKSTLALKYAETYKADYQFVHFIHAENEECLIDGLLKLADILHLPDRGVVVERLKMLAIFLDRLDKPNLLIFDGIDHVESFYTVAPHLSAKSVCLLTTSTALDLSADEIEIVELQPFSTKEAVNYVLKANVNQTETQAKILVEKLGGFPLALACAGGYILRKKIGIEQYVAEFNKYRSNSTDQALLSKEEMTLSAVLNMSIKQDFLAQEVLECFAFLGKVPISLNFLKGWLQLYHPSADFSKLEEAIKYLLDLSVIDSPCSETYVIHPLVRKLILYQMPSTKQQQLIFEQCLGAWTTYMLTHENRLSREQKMFAFTHAMDLLQNENFITMMDIKKQWDFLNKLGGLCLVLGKAQQSLEISQRCLTIALKWKQKDGISVESEQALFDTHNSIGQAFLLLANNSQACKSLQRACRIAHLLYGNEHLNVSLIYRNIGLAMVLEGRWEEALEYFEKTLQMQLTTVGDSHTLVIGTYNNIGEALKSLGKNDKAVVNFNLAIDTQILLLGKNHPNLIRDYYNLGLYFLNLRRSGEALDCFQNALKIQVSHFGENHPDVAVNCIQIASIFQSSGKHGEALVCLQKAVEIQISFFGEDHPDVATCYNNMGMNPQNLIKSSNGLELIQKALKIWISLYGEKHATVALGYTNASIALQALGRFSESLISSQKSLDIRLDVLGKKHPLVAQSYNNLGAIYQLMNKPKEALDCFDKTLLIYVELYGENHQDVANTYSNIGTTFQSLGNFQKGFEYYQTALEIQQKIYGEQHQLVAQSYTDLGIALRFLGKPKDALDHYLKALEIWISTSGENHPDVARSYRDIGTTQKGLGRIQDAIDTFHKELKILTAVYGRNHLELATCYSNLGGLFQISGEFEEALSFFKKAESSLILLLGINHPNVKAIQKFLQKKMIPFLCLKDDPNNLVYEILSGKMAINNGRYGRAKTTPLQHTCFYLAIQRLMYKTVVVSLDHEQFNKLDHCTIQFLENMNKSSSCEVSESSLLDEIEHTYQLKPSSWNPGQSIDSLLQALRECGPLIVSGYFGKHCYVELPIKIEENQGGKIVQKWPHNSKRVNNPQLSCVIVVGVMKVEDPGKEGGYIYFLDPTESSDPENPKDDIVYKISYQNLKTHAKRFELMKADAVHLL